MSIENVAVIALAIAAWFFLFRYGKTSSANAHRLVARVGELKKEGKPVVVYCASGARSGQARRVLVREGIAHVYDLGGMGRW